MSGFSAEWLALREPFDAAARSTALVQQLRARLAVGMRSAPLSVVDLGAGAGSNLRYLAPLLGGTQRWRLVDHDGALLAVALATTRELDCEVRCEQRDLATLGDLTLPTGCLVTAAALLDLVSASWLDALAEQCAQAHACVLFALTYDGRTVCTPPDPEDAAALALFNSHQLGDKGFGPALGPGAPSAAEAAFLRCGYRVVTGRSDWQLGADDRAMQHALLDGWLAAAENMAPERRAQLSAWHARRRALVDARRSTLRVGHVDLVGWL
jgi:SAM-dependent methyltransferase